MTHKSSSKASIWSVSVPYHFLALNDEVLKLKFEKVSVPWSISLFMVILYNHYGVYGITTSITSNLLR